MYINSLKVDYKSNASEIHNWFNHLVVSLDEINNEYTIIDITIAYSNDK